MKVHYGEFAGTEGADGDPVDVFVGPDPDASTAYVVATQDPATKAYDECKVMLVGLAWACAGPLAGLAWAYAGLPVRPSDGPSGVA